MRTPFEQFCLKTATKNHMLISDNLDIPDDIKASLNTLIDIMKPKMERLDSVSVSFIEACFNDNTAVEETLTRNTVDNEIPDGIFNELSRKLYDEKMFNDLDDTEQSIIKVLACYLMLSRI